MALPCHDRPQRRSLRPRGYDDAQLGAYCVTLRTYGHVRLCGQVVDGAMRLNEFGEIASSCWHAIPAHFPHVRWDAFVVMPHHVHSIIWIVVNNPVGARPYEHIIRHDESLNHIRQYIAPNPLRWHLDGYNRARMGNDLLAWEARARGCPAGWGIRPPFRGRFFHHIARHATVAGRRRAQARGWHTSRLTPTPSGASRTARQGLRHQPRASALRLETHATAGAQQRQTTPKSIRPPQEDVP